MRTGRRGLRVEHQRTPPAPGGTPGDPPREGGCPGGPPGGPGGARGAHFFGYLITLPVGTRTRTPFFGHFCPSGPFLGPPPGFSRNMGVGRGNPPPARGPQKRLSLYAEKGFRGPKTPQKSRFSPFPAKQQESQNRPRRGSRRAPGGPPRGGPPGAPRAPPPGAPPGAEIFPRARKFFPPGRPPRDRDWERDYAGRRTRECRSEPAERTV